MRRAAALGDRPDYQGLAASHVSRREDAFTGSHKVRAGLHVSSIIKFHAKLLQQKIMLRMNETYGDYHQVRLDLKVISIAAA